MVNRSSTVHLVRGCDLLSGWCSSVIVVSGRRRGRTIRPAFPQRSLIVLITCAGSGWRARGILSPFSMTATAYRPAPTKPPVWPDARDKMRPCVRCVDAFPSRRRSPRSWTATPRPRSLTPGAMTLSRPGLPRRVLGWPRRGKSSDRTPEHLLCIADDFVDDLGRWLNARHEADALAGPVRERFSVASHSCARRR